MIRTLRVPDLIRDLLVNAEAPDQVRGGERLADDR